MRVATRNLIALPARSPSTVSIDQACKLKNCTAWCRRASGILAISLLGATPVVSLAAAGEVLQAVKARGHLNCGVSEGITGFSAQDARGRWVGLDADFCRAVAAAALDDAEKVRFVPLRSSTRFPALQAGKIDLLVRNTTWTLTREALLKVQFPAVLYYDGQAFMVARSAGIRTPADLDGAAVCVDGGRAEDGGAVAEGDAALRPRGNVVLMGDEDHGDAACVQLLEQRDDLVGGAAVERAGRLVGEQQARAVDERARDRHALALAARELIGAVLEPIG